MYNSTWKSALTWTGSQWTEASTRLTTWVWLWPLHCAVSCSTGCFSSGLLDFNAWRHIWPQCPGYNIANVPSHAFILPSLSDLPPLGTDLVQVDLLSYTSCKNDICAGCKIAVPPAPLAHQLCVGCMIWPLILFVWYYKWAAPVLSLCQTDVSCNSNDSINSELCSTLKSNNWFYWVQAVIFTVM